MTSSTFGTLLLLSLVWTPIPAAVAAQNALTVRDRLEIQELYARYAQTFDLGDAEGWANTFAEDGVFGASQGRTELIEYAKGRFPRYGGHSRHWNSQLTLTPTTDGVRGVVYIMLWDVGTRPRTIIASGIYRDIIVKTPEGWRFKTRVVEGDQPTDGGN
jgi:hypothetical protein